MSREALIWLNADRKRVANLKLATYRILECIARLHSTGVGCTVSQIQLAGCANLSKPTVNTPLDILEKTGLIARERGGLKGRGKRARTRYHLPFEKTFERFRLASAVSGMNEDDPAPASDLIGPVPAPPPVQNLESSYQAHRNNTGMLRNLTPSVVQHCLAVCGPGLCAESRKVIEQSNHIVTEWLAAGYSLEHDILPALKRRSARIKPRVIHTPRGNRMDKKYIYRMLNNRAYIGEAVHKEKSYPGEHKAIIGRKLWDKVHAIVQQSPRQRANRTRAQTCALLKGMLFGPDGAPSRRPTPGRAASPIGYYVSQTVLKHGAGSCPVGRAPSGEIETAIIDQLRTVFRQPEIVAGTWKRVRAQSRDISEADV